MVKLHIGGKERNADWKILDIEDRPEVDFLGDASNLSQFAEGSVEAIYASHVLEHFYYGLNSELLNVLKEWKRVLKTGGQLLISVPDMQKLCWLYLNPSCTPADRYQLMRIMFGGQTNQYDVHKVGFDIDILAMYLIEAGFEDINTTSEFGIFQKDCSSLRIMNTLISLNVVAKK